MEKQENRKVLAGMYAQRGQTLVSLAERIAKLKKEYEEEGWEQTGAMLERLRERVTATKAEQRALRAALDALGFSEGDKVVVNVPGESEHGKEGTVLAVWGTGRVLVDHGNVHWTYRTYELLDAEETRG